MPLDSMLTALPRSSSKRGATSRQRGNIPETGLIADKGSTPSQARKREGKVAACVGRYAPPPSERGERAIWQRRFWEHLIRDEEDFRRHVEYCYINPLKHGLVARVRDWPHSSFHRDVRAGLFPEDWAGDVSAQGRFGERG